mmetsp:Transcript_62333/g.178844  ORF Transcript_62333/g.178844 Transcript_62333/m.178844 type:complete len:499 (-) Transcript_62333:837-2333(-)
MSNKSFAILNGVSPWLFLAFKLALFSSNMPTVRAMASPHPWSWGNERHCDGNLSRRCNDVSLLELQAWGCAPNCKAKPTISGVSINEIPAAFAWATRWSFLRSPARPPPKAPSTAPKSAGPSAACRSRPASPKRDNNDEVASNASEWPEAQRAKSHKEAAALSNEALLGLPNLRSCLATSAALLQSAACGPSRATHRVSKLRGWATSATSFGCAAAATAFRSALHCSNCVATSHLPCSQAQCRAVKCRLSFVNALIWIPGVHSKAATQETLPAEAAVWRTLQPELSTAPGSAFDFSANLKSGLWSPRAAKCNTVRPPESGKFSSLNRTTSLSCSLCSLPRQATFTLSSSNSAICCAAPLPPRAAACRGVSLSAFVTQGSMFLRSRYRTASSWFSSTATCSDVAPSLLTAKSTSFVLPAAFSNTSITTSRSSCGRVVSMTPRAARTSSLAQTSERFTTDLKSRISAIRAMSSTICTLRLCVCFTVSHLQSAQSAEVWFF